MKEKSYAKLNIALNVTNKSKPSNFHDLDMLNICIDLYQGGKSMNEKKEETNQSQPIIVNNNVTPEKKVVCDMCGYANPEHTAICKIHSQ